MCHSTIISICQILVSYDVTDLQLRWMAVLLSARYRGIESLLKDQQTAQRGLNYSPCFLPHLLTPIINQRLFKLE